jgi:hypothetical protein
MTRHGNPDKAAHKEKKHATRHAGNRPGRTRLMVGLVVLSLAFIGFVTLFDRKDLPAGVRDNPYVAQVYHERDAALAATSALIERHAATEVPADANADMKQQGYPKEDRAKLDTIIKGKPQ